MVKIEKANFRIHHILYIYMERENGTTPGSGKGEEKDSSRNNLPPRISGLPPTLGREVYAGMERREFNPPFLMAPLPNMLGRNFEFGNDMTRVSNLAFQPDAVQQHIALANQMNHLSAFANGSGKNGKKQ